MSSITARIRRFLPPWLRPRAGGLGAVIAHDDSLTERILARVLREDTCAADIGCNEGQILRSIVRLAPRGRHHAFEALPALAAGLRRTFPEVRVHAVALSDELGETDFQHVENDPGYSGLRRRRYDRPDPVVQTIRVPVSTLDHELGHDGPTPPADRIGFLKIDVEGAELQVLRGAEKTLARDRPTVIFEHGRGAAEFYGTTPAAIHALLVDHHGMRIHTLGGFLDQRAPLDLQALQAVFERGEEWNFVASPAP